MPSLSRLLIRFALVLFALALFFFFGALISKTFTLIVLSNKLTGLAISLLLSAFSLFLLLLISLIIQASIQSIRHYYSIPQRALRRLYRSQQQHAIVLQGFIEQSRYIEYMSAWRRKKLAEQDDKKQFLLLSSAIKNDLMQAKKTVSKTEFKQFMREYKNCYRKRNSAGLIVLQQRLMERVFDI